MTAKKTATKTATKKTAAPRKVTKARECAYGDRNEVVATRETPRGTHYLCEVHASQIRRIGGKVEEL